MYCVRVFAGAEVGEGEFETVSVLVGGKGVEVAVSIGTIVLIGSEVADGMDVSVGVEGWKESEWRSSLGQR